MSLFAVTKDFHRTKSAGSRSGRETLEREQLKNFRQLLRHAWVRSAFYRDYYSSHGLRAKDLSEISIADLPILPKKTLMDNFDGAVTDPRLNRRELEKWFQDHPDPRENYSKDFVVIHSSGVSGDIGIFVYDRNAWRLADSAIAQQLPAPENYPWGKTKVAFYAASHGHFAMVSIAAAMPTTVYDTLILSLLDARDRTVGQLNAFQPHRLYGYASSIADLAELALEGKLRIRPTSIFVAGDKLWPAMEKKIREAWPAEIYITYGTSESKYIAVKTPDRPAMSVLENLNVFEVLDDQDQAVSAGQQGRVILSNLYNNALPILRYELGDYVVVGQPERDSPFTSILDIKGRVNDALPVLAAGKLDNIHPIVLSEFFVPGLEKVQFVSRRPDSIGIFYVAGDNIDVALRQGFQRILDMKGASETSFEIHRVKDIPNDAKTGKLRLVRIDREGASWPREFETFANDHGTWQSYQSLPPTPPPTEPTMAINGCLGLEPLVAQEGLSPADIEQTEIGYVHSLIEAQAKRTPESISVVCGNQSLSYNELNARANQLARHLQSLGVTSNSLVAICVHRSIDMAVGILAILKAGGAWVPMDPVHPRERQQYVMEDTRAGYLLTQQALVGQIPFQGGKTILLDNDWPSIARQSRANIDNIVNPSNLAYVMYTSGSTGKPKGVMITQANLFHYVLAMGATLGITAQDNYLHTATVAFSSSVRQLFLPLAHGARVIVATTDEIRQPVELFAMAKRQKVSIIDVVPSYWRNSISLLMSLNEEVRQDILNNHIRLILTASEPLQSDLPKKWWFDLGHGASIINMFGQTETTGIAALFPITHNSDDGNKIIPIGKPIPRTKIYLLDEKLNPVPDGTPGEVYVGGPGVGRGYWNRAELTLEKFLGVPFNAERVENLYRTGDLARVHLDGNLHFLGRVDDQVKIRGVRIEPGEVEAVLGEHRGIKEIVVVARENQFNDKVLVAYFAPADERPASTKKLREFLKSRLPEYMIPSAFIELDSLPRTPSGKIDRRALPAVQTNRSKSEYIYAATIGAVELKLVGMWQSLLGVSRIGIDDDFFDLGGHSFLAMRMFAQTVTTFGKTVPIAAFFQTPTIRQLAKLVRGEQQSTLSSSLVALQPDGNRPPFFWVHGDSKDVDSLLPSYLGPDQPFYHLEQPFAHGKPVALKTVEDLASHYLETLRVVQPKGPFLLGGYCFGGVVAFEMSQQLRNQGEEVALLVLLAPPRVAAERFSHHNGSDIIDLPAIIRGMRANTYRHLSNLKKLSSREKINYVGTRLNGMLIDGLERVNAISKRVGTTIFWQLLFTTGRPLPPSQRVAYILQVYLKALRRYAAKHYYGKITIFNAREDQDNTDSWRIIAGGGFEVHEVPGDHEGVMQEKAVRSWAPLLREQLVKAQADSSTKLTCDEELRAQSRSDAGITF